MRIFARKLIVDLHLELSLTIACAASSPERKSVINSFAGKRLDHARGIADQKQIFVRRRKRSREQAA